RSPTLSKSTCTGIHIWVPVRQEFLLPATLCADEFFSLFFKGVISRLNSLEPQLTTAHATQRGRRFNEGTHVMSLTKQGETRGTSLTSRRSTSSHRNATIVMLWTKS